MNTMTVMTSQPLAGEAISDWQAEAIAVYRQGEHETVAALGADLRRRLLALTGHLLAPNAIYVDGATQTAQAKVDGMLFRLQRQELMLIKDCAWCGQGQYASPSIANRADLGYALSVWEPHCPDCQPEDPAEW